MITRALLLCLLVATLRAPARQGDGGEVQEGESLARLTISEVLADADADTVPDRLGERVRVRGVVTIPPGVLAQQYFQVIVEDPTGGVSLFSYELSLSLEVGDEVEAVGEVGQYRGAVQIQEVEVSVLGEAPIPAYRPVSLGQAASWSNFGRRVQVRGTAGEVEITSFGTMPLRDEAASELTVYFPQKVMRSFPFGMFPPGSEIEVAGVVSIVDQSWPFDSGFQLVVTEPEHISLLAEPPPAWRSWLAWGAVLAVVLLLTVIGVAYALHRRQRMRERELATLNALSSGLSTRDLSREQLAELAADILIQHGLFDAVVVHGIDDGVIRLLAAAGIPESVVDGLDYGATAAEELDSERLGELVDASAVAQSVSRAGLSLLELVPVTAGGRAYGLLSVFSRRLAQPNAAQRSTLVASAKLVALAMENIEGRQRAEADREALQQLVITDDLTQLYNRRFLDEYLRIQVPMARRRGHQLAFVAADLDHFKRVNDSWGHAAGDRILAGVAEQLRTLTRASDLPVRFGGEEFLIVIADTDLAGAEAFAERLRERIESMSFGDVVPGERIAVTVSVGVALYPQHADTVSGVLAACDAALYAAKEGGRNRVSIAPGTD